ncbi:MAG: hypothetical protein K8S98_03290 [Planctomycetes bacterium]|nr:hypothetical protein [Planctomycetota bacterium]
MTTATRRLELLLALVLVGWLAFAVRDVPGLAHPYAPAGNGDARWFSVDADGLYHMRRVARAIDEGSVAERDPYLNFPDGAAIPWPPYYDALLARVLGPFAPSDANARREFLEHAVATAPLVFAVLTTLLVALIAWRVAGTGAALVAGACYALSRAAVNYQLLGNGDHHAAVTFCFAALLGVLTFAPRAKALESPGRGALCGVVAGALAGFAVGVWVASFVFVLYAQLTFGWLMVRRSKERLAGVGAFSLAFHLTALAVLLPAVLSSPWRAEFPWMVVNLSNFHVVELGVGAAISLPIVAAHSGPFALERPAARAYPWVVAMLLTAAGVALALLDVGPAAGIREGFEWVSRTNSFMDVVRESAPLIGERAEPGALFFALGYAVPVVVIAWIAIAWRAFRRGQHELLAWAIVIPPMAIQALQQRRFAEIFSVPLAFALAVGAVWLVARLRERSASFARIPRVAWGVVGLGLVAAAQAQTIDRYFGALDPKANFAVGTQNDHYVGERMLCEWIREHTSPGDWCVLAHWDRGHMIEWAADRPTVATNFGSYVGRDSYCDPARFFMAEDSAEAEAILDRRRARFVVVTAALASSAKTLEGTAKLPAENCDSDFAHDDERARASWLTRVGGQLIGDGAPRSLSLQPIGDSLSFLRLVHTSPYRDTRFSDPRTGRAVPVGSIWECVRGANVEANGPPQKRFEVTLELDYPGRDFPLVFRTSATVDEHGVARVRVPYATDRPNGDGVARGALKWRIGSESGEVAIPESAVLAGSTLRVR